MNIPFGDKEVAFIKKMYIGRNKPVKDLVGLVNNKFWKGKLVRSYRSIECKVHKLGCRKRGSSNYSSGNIDAKVRELFRLKKAGKSLGEISKLLSMPIGTVKSKLHYIKHYTILNEVNELKQKKLSKDKDVIELEGREELLRRNEDLQKRLEKASAVTSIIVDTVKETLMRVKPVKVPEIIIRKGMHKPETAILEFGDVHVGEKVIKEDVANVTEYNFNIFMKRMDILMQGVAECIDIQRSKIPINTLDINMLGDIITGEDIYLGQNRNIDLMLTQQTLEAANVICNKLLIPCAKLFNKIRVRTVFGNHGRPSRPGQFHPKTNFDYIVYLFLKERMREQKNIEFYIADCPLMLYRMPEAPNYVHLMSHGDEVGRWMSIPFYGLQRDHGKYVQLFGMNINYWHSGHSHSSAKIDVPYGEQIINGTFVGGSELSVLRMKTMSQPKQLLFGFNNIRGKTWSFDIQLEARKTLIADESGIFTPTYSEKNLLSNMK